MKEKIRKKIEAIDAAIDSLYRQMDDAFSWAEAGKRQREIRRLKELRRKLVKRNEL